MNINAIEIYNKNNIKSTSKAGIKKVIENSSVKKEELVPQKVFASHFGFKSRPATDMLMRDYKWFVNHDRQPAMEAFLGLLAPKELMEEVFIRILQDDKLAYDMVDSVVSQPRRAKHYFAALQRKLPPQSNCLKMFIPTNEYKLAYEKYLDKRVQNTGSISELLKIRPDWQEELLLQKHYELYGNHDFELGRVPQDIGCENYLGIVDYLRGFMDYGYKTVKNIPDLSINNKTFKFTNIIDGKSDKNVFIVETQNGEKYVLKVADVANRGLNKPFAIGTCAIIDTYLTQNNCRNSAPLKYYNHNTNSSLYDYIEHKTSDKIENLQGFVDKMPDFVDLGLHHNDTVGVNNYFMLDSEQKNMKSTYDFMYGVEHKELVSVDNDHVSYSNPLNPFVYKYNKELPIAMQMFF